MIHRRYIPYGGIIDYDPDFLTKEEASQLLLILQKKVNWEQVFYTNYKTGEKFPQPRLTAWYADDSDMAYSYSGITQKVQPWLPELLTLKNKIEDLTKAEYNSVLLNFYRTGYDSVGMHADNEKELGSNATIASISLGYPRRFILSNYRRDPNWQPDPATEITFREEGGPPGVLEYELTHGSLLVMGGTTQHYWKHEIPKEVLTPGQIKTGVQQAGQRVNLTFRKFIKA